MSLEAGETRVAFILTWLFAKINTKKIKTSHIEKAFDKKLIHK